MIDTTFGAHLLPRETRQIPESALAQHLSAPGERAAPQRWFHQAVEEQAALHPEAPAVIAGQERLTYQLLNACSNQLARHLQRRGVGPEVPVGLCLEPSVELLVGLVGILKAGGAYVPLDPTYPAERLEFMLSDAEVQVLLTDSAQLSRLPRAPRLEQVICLDREAPVIMQERWTPLSRVVDSDQLAYILYTSGSTGQPKGVEVTQESLGWYLTALHQSLDIAPEDSVLQTASPAFSASIRQIMLPLSLGACLVIANREQRANPLALLTLIKQAGVTVWDTVPTLWRHCISTLEYLTPQARRALLDNHLRLILTTGERLDWQVPQDWAAFSHPARIINLYSQTETTGTVCMYPLAGPLATASGTVPLGHPLAQTPVYVLDGSLTPVAPGEIGELYVGGPRLARGYRNRPEMTAERFVPDPFHPERPARLYKTGDLARLLPDHTLESVGRGDQRLKLRGFTIEPGEVERCLNQHPAIQESVVALREDETGYPHLVAYLLLQPSEGHMPDPELPGQLRAFLKSKLPDYLIPTAWSCLDAFPQTESGKVDRRALSASAFVAMERAGQSLAPRTPLEEQIASVWSEVLGRRVGVTEDFFENGGDSLRATQISIRLQDRLGVKVELRTFFEAPTIAQLATAITTAHVRPEASSLLPPVQPVRDSATRHPMALQQEQLWLFEQLQGAERRPAYTVSVAVRLCGPLDRQVLADSLQALVDRHETLRTSFQSAEGRPHQVIASRQAVSLNSTDVSLLPQEERDQAMMQVLQDAASRPFDLSSPPLFSAHLVRLAEEEHALLWLMHHSIVDGWSKALFLRELSTVYQARLAGRASPLPDLPIQYADYACWQQRVLAEPFLAADLVYWKEQLRGLPPVLELPTDRPRPARQTFRGATCTFHLPRAFTEALTRLSHQEGVTLYLTLLAAWQTLLHRYTAQEDITIGSPVANRLRPELEPLLGFFANLLVLRGDLSGNPSFSELLRRTRDVAFAAHAHQLVPFERLVQELQPERSLGYQPLVQVAFTLQPDPLEQLTLPGVTVLPLEVESGATKFDLTLAFTQGAEGLRGALEYNRDLFEHSTIERLAEHYQTLLAAVLADPTESIATLPLLSPAERERLLVEWNATGTPLPPLTVVDLFEAQARATPQALAVSAGTRRLTYAALAGQATQLAHALRRLGVGPEVRVGVCLERSVELIVGFLGILKAGGAYVPLDPAYPPERLTYLAHDAALPVILTTSSLLPRLPDMPRCTVFCLDREAERLAEESRAALPGPALDQLAYTIYTSGSTGQPKGVEILHRGVLNMALWHQDTFGLTAADRVTQLVSPSFDVAGAELWPALLVGACVCVPDEETRLAPAALRDWLLAQQITLTILPTPLAERVLALPWPENGTLRWLLTGGDILRRSPAPGLPFTLVNNYGPTEASVVATATRVEPLDAPEGLPSIGRPIANTQIYLLDQHRQLVPIGVPGELHIGGVGLARGYLNRPELTEARFLPHPFSQAKGARLYKTGDLARYRPDGTLEFLGRLDNQVKVRGFRIEPAEIEAVLARHPSIAEAVVLAREDLAGEKVLVAYVVAGESLSLSASELRTFALESLPEYMVPAHFVWLERLPLTPNGKVDRKALPQQAQVDLHSMTPFVPPRHIVEEQLAALWAEVLDLPVERVGIFDDFFALGGHSLRATQLLARIQATFQVELPLRAVFAAPTIAGLLEQLAQSAADQADEQTLTAALAELAQEGGSEIPAIPSSKELKDE